MGRLFTVAVGFTSLGLLLGFCLWRGSYTALAGQAAENCAAQNGDVNADGQINLTDAVTILGHLFLGSPTELLPLCAPSPTTSGLPDTGQVLCYDDAGKEITCNSASCPGQDGASATGCPSEGRFTDNGDGTVTDNCTGLMWQKDSADVNADGQLTDQDHVRWCQALAYCENLSFAGHDDWRLPNVRELESIVDYGGRIMAIDPVFGALSMPYWSSTSSAALPDDAWAVFFVVGSVNGYGKEGDHHVRAVRNAP